MTNVEHKMGWKVSATCELSLGVHGVPPGAGSSAKFTTALPQMFDVIEQARMMVGTKAIATLSTGYLNALVRQEPHPGRRHDPDDRQDRAAVSITHHPDVRRSLMTRRPTPKVCALYLYTASYQTRPSPRFTVSTPNWREGQRPAAADRQGRRLRAGVC